MKDQDNKTDVPESVECADCGRLWPRGEFPGDIASIEDLYERLDPGSEVPAGECPECGALCYLQKQAKPDAILAALLMTRDFLRDMSDRDELQNHDLDGHDADQCVLCTVNAAIAMMEQSKGTTCAD